MRGRRGFIKKAAVAAVAASAFPPPAISQGKQEWRMVTAWPKGLPGLGTGAELLGKRITTMSGGRLTVRVFAAGELVPGLQTFEAVQNGTAEMGHDTPGFHLGKHRAFAYFFGPPFGMAFQEHVAWLHHGGGQALWDELSAQFGLKSFAIGNIGTPSFGWFKKELKSAADLKGIKMRMPGIGSEMIRRLGAVPTLMAPGDLFPALQAGTLDATDFTGPANDMALGFHQVCKYLYFPCIQKPGAIQQVIISKQKFDALPNDLKEVVTVACQAAHLDMLAEYNWINAKAIQALKGYKVNVLSLPNDILEAFGNVAGEILFEERDKLDPLGKKIWEAYFKARSDLMAMSNLGDRELFNARNLKFKYPA
ncbi:MAG: TRAP transporter substrate-binding protein [Burkholderiales bacterium]|nr:TRAP transporter substrate-binding protein [Burkholderiales bacterium]